jgi:hypothetical protein
VQAHQVPLVPDMRGTKTLLCTLQLLNISTRQTLWRCVLERWRCSLRRQLHGMKRGALQEPRAHVAVWGSFKQHVLDRQAGEARDQSCGCVAAREIAQTACPCTSIDLESCSKASNNRADSPALRVQRSSQLPHWGETRLSLPLQHPWRAVGDVSTFSAAMPDDTVTDNRQARTSDVSRTGLDQARFEISGSPSATAVITDDQGPRTWPRSCAETATYVRETGRAKRRNEDGAAQGFRHSRGLGLWHSDD